MFENLLSFGSLLAITISVTLTIKTLKIKYVDNSSVIKSNIQGDNNNLIVNYSNYSNEISDFKKLIWCIEVFLLVGFPAWPNFFISFLSSFSFLSILICATGVYKNIQRNTNNGIYGIFYLLATIVISFLSITAISIARTGEYLFTGYYARLYNNFFGSSSAIQYPHSMISIVGEGAAYLGFSLIFISLVHCCFGYLNKNKNFDLTFNSIFVWLPASVFGYLFACGGVIAALNLNFKYILFLCENSLHYFFLYFS